MNEDIFKHLNTPETKNTFHALGKAFLGRKNPSTKDGSYTATLWMCFMYLPIYPYDTYRVLMPRSTVLPKTFSFDEYIYIKNARLPFDTQQVYFTIFKVYGIIAAIFLTWLYLILEYGSLTSLGFLVGTLLIFGAWVGLVKLDIRKHAKKEVKVDEPAKSAPAVAATAKPPSTVSTRHPSKPVSSHLPAPSPSVVEVQQVQLEKVSVPITLEKDIASLETVKVEPEQVKVVDLPKEPVHTHTEIPLQVEKPKHIEKPEPEKIKIVPQPVPVAREATVRPAEIKIPADMPAQPKFDPNKIMEWNASHLDLNPIVQPPKPDPHTLTWLALLTIVLLCGQLMLEFYEVINPGDLNHVPGFKEYFQLDFAYYILSAAGLFLAVGTIKKDPIISVPLFLVSMAFIFRLQEYLFDFILKNISI